MDAVVEMIAVSMGLMVMGSAVLELKGAFGSGRFASPFRVGPSTSAAAEIVNR